METHAWQNFLSAMAFWALSIRALALGQRSLKSSATYDSLYCWVGLENNLMG